MLRLKSIFIFGASFALIGMPSVSAQILPQIGQDKTDQQLKIEGAEHKKAYRSGDAKQIVREKADLRSAYVADWRSDHPRSTSQTTTLSAEQRLAIEKERFKAVFKSGNKSAISRERRKLRLAYAEAHRAHEENNKD